MKDSMRKAQQTPPGVKRLRVTIQQGALAQALEEYAQLKGMEEEELVVEAVKYYLREHGIRWWESQAQLLTRKLKEMVD